MKDARGRELKDGDIILIPIKKTKASGAVPTLGVYKGKSGYYLGEEQRYNPRTNTYEVKEIAKRCSFAYCYKLEMYTKEEEILADKIWELLRKGNK